MKTYRQSSRFRRVVRRSAGTRPMAKLYGLIQQPLDRIAFRLTGRRATVSSWLSGIEISMLTTTGAKTGRPRTLPVLALPDGEDVILIASNFGRPRHPSWYHNLRADPHATIVAAGAEPGVRRPRAQRRRSRPLLRTCGGDLPRSPGTPGGPAAPDTGAQAPRHRHTARLASTYEPRHGIGAVGSTARC